MLNSQFLPEKTASVSDAAVPRVRIRNWELSIGQIPSLFDFLLSLPMS